MRHHASGDFAASRAFLARLKRRDQAARQPRCMDHGGRFICADGSHASVNLGSSWAVDLNQDLYVGVNR